MEAPSKVFLLFSLLPDWLKLGHLKSGMECGFKTFFAPYLFHRRGNNWRDKLRSKFWRKKNVQKTTFEAAELMPGPWNQQNSLVSQGKFCDKYRVCKKR